MINFEKHILYWRNSAQEDLDVAANLVASGKIRHGLFFLHLTLEKILKATICKHTKDIPPRTHNLVRLAEISGIEFDNKQIDFFIEMNPMNIEGRYPGTWAELPSQEEAEQYLRKTKKVYEWLITQL